MRSDFMKNFIIILLLFGMLLSVTSCTSECSHDEIATTVIPPTCDTAGYTLNKCNSCAFEFQTNTVAPLGHTFQTSVISPDCDHQGYSESECSVCKLKYKSNYTMPLGHMLSIEETAPTCDAEGYKHARCSVCDYEYVYDVVAPTGHDFTTKTVHIATCKQDGSTTYKCDCGFSYVGDYRFYSDIYRGAYVENTTVLAKGVDTSKWNHTENADGSLAPLDWTKIKSAGYDFAILRLGYIGVKDPALEADYTAAKAAGLDVGAYFYTHAKTVEEAREEAEYCLTLLEGKQFEYPIYLDIEDTNLESLDKDTLTNACIEFISILQENGYYASLYCNNNWLKNKLRTAKVTTLFDIWYARFPSLSGVVNEATWNTESYGQQMAMWQFSQTGTIEGITKADGTQMSFDLNYCYKDYPTIIKELGYNGFDAPPPLE